MVVCGATGETGLVAADSVCVTVAVVYEDSSISARFVVSAVVDSW